MLLEKPSEVRHSNAAGQDCAIYAIDAHPNQLKVATGGGDTCVKIWSIVDKDGPCFELLATLAWHEKSVNCVRWSHSGKYLASGSDDHSVFIYEFKEGAPSAVPFGSKQQPNKEKWERCAILKNHTMDVQDVAWSPDDRMLATCSIDNSILIWSMDQITPVMTHPIQHLTGHNGWVKGVAWDPVGKYLTSAGEDKSVIVWKVDTWEIEERIQTPFELCASSSHFRRLSWSPDGSLICATHAHKSKQDVGALVERKSWVNEVNFVGHRGVVTTARFNPRLLAKKSTNKEFTCCALGGDDCTVSIWLADVARPLAVVKDCFDASVTDLSWSHDGFTLFSSSLDGSICFFQFTADELGTPITPQQQSRLLQQKYGSLAGLTSGSTLVEDPLQLELEACEKSTGPTSTMDMLAKRITPMGEASQVLNQAPAPSVFTLTARPKSTTAPEKDIATPKTTDNNEPQAPAANTLVPRPKPIAITNTENISPKTAQPPTIAVTEPTAVKAAQKALEPTTNTVKPTAPASEPTANSITTLVARPKSKAPATTSAPPSSIQKDDDNAPIKRKRNLEVTPAAKARSSMLVYSIALVAGLLKFFCRVEADEREDVLAEISPRDVFNHTITLPRNKTRTLECRVSDDSCNITCTEAGDCLWMDRLPGHVVCMAGNQSFCAFGTEDGSLYIVSATGRRLFPCMALGHGFASIETSPNATPYLLVVLRNGAVKTWNVLQPSLFIDTTLRSMVTFKSTLIRSLVTDKGQPIVTMALSSGGRSRLHSFTFDLAMKCWMRVADDHFSYSDFTTSVLTDTIVVASEVPVGPLRRLQNASSHARNAKNMLDNFTNINLQRHVTRTHLEQQLTSAIALQSRGEYKYWLVDLKGTFLSDDYCIRLKIYARYLAQEGDVARLEELCTDLVGPMSASSTTVNNPRQTWQPLIMDMVKRDLLRTIVMPQMATNRILQRLVTKYRVQLDTHGST
ncbi:hypothetical protein THRCLA_09472 [Thraustotheca clavata]|uniref:Protein HIRA n=1 Tax=Thraustotheca clavata TaxID=74557 RepID=A0A1V9YWA3_9STRA|nr:hypothetical protein THRCLA_09472 [Thraustotheca clavata]